MGSTKKKKIQEGVLRLNQFKSLFRICTCMDEKMDLVMETGLVLFAKPRWLSEFANL